MEEIYRSDELDNLTTAYASQVDLFSEPKKPEISLVNLSISSSLLLIAVAVGIPLNGATVMIFFRRKKLQHLINFILLLDCLSHIILCFICIPIHLAREWILPSRTLTYAWFILLVLQQVVGNFVNLSGLFLTLSIAVLRYRRLCWKKKDRFSLTSALKWSVTSGAFPTGLSVVQGGFFFSSHNPPALYIVKLALIFTAILAVFFCYMRLAQRVWSSGAGKRLMDPSKLKKSKSVHMRATMHSCIQIVLIVLTLCPYLYMETMTTFVDQEKNNGSSHISSSDRLWSITVNYILLILGTPLAYVASCHRFREQFVSLLSPCGHSPKKIIQQAVTEPEVTKGPLDLGRVLENSSFHAILGPEKGTVPFQDEEEEEEDKGKRSQSRSSSWDYCSKTSEGSQLSSMSLASSSASGPLKKPQGIIAAICIDKNKLAVVPYHYYYSTRRRDFIEQCGQYV